MKSDDAAETFCTFRIHPPLWAVMKKKGHILPVFIGKVYIYYERRYDEYIYIMNLRFKLALIS
jgi:hypothetical protein